MDDITEWAGGLPSQPGMYRVRTIPTTRPPARVEASDLEAVVEEYAEEVAAQGGGRVAVRLPDGSERTVTVPGAALAPRDALTVEVPRGATAGASLDSVSLAHALQAANRTNERLAAQVVAMAREQRETMKVMQGAVRDSLQMARDAHESLAKTSEDLSAALIAAADTDGGFWDTPAAKTLVEKADAIVGLMLAAKAGG